MWFLLSLIPLRLVAGVAFVVFALESGGIDVVTPVLDWLKTEVYNYLF